MYPLFMILIILVCVLLTLIVLVQNSKGGGLASNFAGSTQVMGVRKTADFLEKATWTLAGALLVLSIFASMAIPKPDVVKQSKIQEQIETNEGAINPNMLPSMPSDYPDQEEE